MSINQSTILKIARRATGAFVLAACAVSAFAVLGDKGKTSRRLKPTLSVNAGYAILPGSFHLKANYNFRGSEVINNSRSEYISLNTVVTYQKGNATYIVPLKKRLYINTASAGFTINH
ncbi:MAG TPA: hypothetical protein VGC95_12985 [Chitinophagaceae bacterium]